MLAEVVAPSKIENEGFAKESAKDTTLHFADQHAMAHNLAPKLDKLVKLPLGLRPDKSYAISPNSNKEPIPFLKFFFTSAG